jgi:hypothetical protein
VEIDKDAVESVSNELAENFHCVLTQVLCAHTCAACSGFSPRSLTHARSRPCTVHVERALAARRRR